MTTTIRSTLRRAGAVLVAASLATVLAGCSADSPAADINTTVASTATPSTVVTPSPASVDYVRIVLRAGDGVAAATLDDTPAAREFAAMLPLRLRLHDAMGQAKTGQLPRRMDTSGAKRVFDPTPGGIYYWPPSGDIGIFHDDLGQSLPPPGMVRLGAVSSGLGAIAAAGNRFTVGIDRADRQLLIRRLG